MKFFILLLVIGVVVQAQNSEDDEKKWKEFKGKHGKKYDSAEKEKERKEIFMKNIREIEDHNKKFQNGEVSYTKGIDQFADMTQDEFVGTLIGLKKEEKELPANVTRRPPPAEVPEHVPDMRQTFPWSLDLRLSGGVGPVKNQGYYCGSCWAFATMAALEYSHWKKYGYVPDLSEQHLVDCDYSNYGCGGGWPDRAYDFIYNNWGTFSEYNYPYVGYQDTCRAPGYKIADLNWPKYYKISGASDNYIKDALNRYGVLVILVDATNWNGYNGYMYSIANYANPDINHAVVLVGYGTSNGIPYWIIKNSWGTTWGASGYMYMDARRDSYGRPYGGFDLNYIYYPTVL